MPLAVKVLASEIPGEQCLLQPLCVPPPRYARTPRSQPCAPVCWPSAGGPELGVRTVVCVQGQGMRMPPPSLQGGLAVGSSMWPGAGGCLIGPPPPSVSALCPLHVLHLRPSVVSKASL